MISLMNVIIDQANHQDLPFWMIQMNGSGCPPSLMLQHWIWSAVVPACFPVGFFAAAVPNAIQWLVPSLHLSLFFFASSLVAACLLPCSFLRLRLLLLLPFKLQYSILLFYTHGQTDGPNGLGTHLKAFLNSFSTQQHEKKWAKAGAAAASMKRRRSMGDEEAKRCMCF